MTVVIHPRHIIEEARRTATCGHYRWLVQLGKAVQAIALHFTERDFALLRKKFGN